MMLPTSENLVLDQPIIPKLILFFILITYLVDIILIMWGEILSLSLMGLKGLKSYAFLIDWKCMQFRGTWVQSCDVSANSK